MKIAYVARHGQVGTSNDDEGAVAYALEQLGHRVERIHEDPTKRLHSYGTDSLAICHSCDLLLFNKWHDINRLKEFKCRKVFWYWDLVEYPQDPTLMARDNRRKRWMAEIMPYVDLGFCTDGDWVAKHQGSNLRWLMQGADERVIGKGQANEEDIPVLFVGSTKDCGQGRAWFLEKMVNRYRKEFVQVQRGVYGRKLADLVARARIVVAPSAPITDRYWSVRIYTMLGFGAFLLHPWPSELAFHYTNEIHYAAYYDQTLFDRIDYYYHQPRLRREIAAAGLERTRKANTYRHRCEELIRIVQEQLP